MPIKLGYEIGTGSEVGIAPSHLIVTGVTQLSGKTTTLEALIKRSRSRAIVFKTKVGETGFTEGTIIPPYFKERSDWQYVSQLLEATLREKLKFERSWIIDVCKNNPSGSLLGVLKNVREKKTETKSSLTRSVLTTLEAYLEIVVPQLQYANFSRTLVLQDGVNIMDLERFSNEIKSLVIRSVLEAVLNEMKNTIVVMPEAWLFLPQGRGNPCKHVAEEFIRQGATNGNYLWIDSQDMTGVDKTTLKQVSTWILGLQTEKNEVVRTLDQMPLPRGQKPSPDEIMTLSVGHFYLCSPKLTKKIYVQPAWLDAETAKDVASGEAKVEDMAKPDRIAPFAILQPEAGPTAPAPEAQKYYVKIQQDMTELRRDIFAKIEEQRQRIETLSGQLLEHRSAKQEVDVDEVVGKVMQKMPTVAGAATYEVAPLEKIQKGFLEEAKNKILEDIQTLSDDEKRVLKYIETQNRGVKANELITKCFFLKPGGSSSVKVSKITAQLKSLELLRKDSGGRSYPHLKERIKQLLEVHNATEQEMDQVHDHILMEML